MSMPPPPPPGPGYGTPYDSPYGGVPQPHPQGTVILVLGILSIFICGIILGPIAWIMGNNAIAEIDRNPAAYSNRSTVNTGRILGIIGTVLAVIILLLYIVAIAASS